LHTEPEFCLATLRNLLVGVSDKSLAQGHFTDNLPALLTTSKMHDYFLVESGGYSMVNKGGDILFAYVTAMVRFCELTGH
jgi:hypothetical protein